MLAAHPSSATGRPPGPLAAFGALIAVVLVLAGCGSGGASSSPLSSALSYFPRQSPFVMSVITDPRAPAIKQAQGLIQRVPVAAFGETALLSKIGQLGIDYDTDIRPLFGNPLLLGIDSSGARGKIGSSFLTAWVTKSAGTLSSLVRKTHFPHVSSYRGATLYQGGTTTIAVDGPTLLLATSKATIMAALDRHARADGMTMDDFDSELSGLPRGALLTAVGNLTSSLSAHAAKARLVPWVAALRGYGVSVSAAPIGLSLQYRLDTSGKTLASSQLPIAAGNLPARLAGTMPIEIGLREPAAILRFVLQVERLVSPARYADDLAQMAAVQRRTGVSFQRDVLGQVGQNAQIDSDGHAFMVRVDVANPVAARATLRKLVTSALGILGTHPGATVKLGPGGFETVRRAHKTNVLFGLVGGEFVAGNTTPAQLRAFGAAPAVPAGEDQGSVDFSISLPSLLKVALRHPPTAIARQLLGLLEAVGGWAGASPHALTGIAALALK